MCIRLLRLEKDKRLGTGANGFEKLKQHEFFSGIDFQNLRENDMSAVEWMKRIAHSSTDVNSFISEEDVNYAVISPQKSYKIEFDYFTPDNPALNQLRTGEHLLTKAKSFNTVKEGLLRKKCGWVFYQNTKLVLTDEPRLCYYSSENSDKVGIFD